MSPPLTVVVGTRTRRTRRACCFTRQRVLLSCVWAAVPRTFRPTEAAGTVVAAPAVSAPPASAGDERDAEEARPRRDGHARLHYVGPPFGRRFDAPCAEADR